MKGMIVEVYHHKKEPEYDYYVLTGSDIPGIVEPSKETPELRLCKKNDYIYCEVVKDLEKGFVCNTGFFVFTPDSRFPCDYPIPVHKSQPWLF